MNCTTLLLYNHNQIFQAWIYCITDTVIALVLATRLSTLEVLHKICNMDTHELPDMYAHSPRALGITIRKITSATIKYYTTSVYIAIV